MSASTDSVGEVRLRALNRSPLRSDGAFVLYWMVAARRLGWNFALQRAVETARVLRKPLVILETLRVGHRWASARFHRLVLDGMAEHKEALEGSPIVYYPYVEVEGGAADGLILSLAGKACAIVTDDYPCTPLPQEQEALAQRIPTRVELVDGNGLLPMRSVDRAYTSAYHFRRALQKQLPEQLAEWPMESPLSAELPPAPEKIVAKEMSRWPMTSSDEMSSACFLGKLPINQDVLPVASPGGPGEACKTLNSFLESRLERYGQERNEPSAGVTSGLSPALHLGHISVHQIFDALADQEVWDPGRVSEDAAGKRSGWWGLSENAEIFLDELVTWRELGFNMCAHRDDYECFESLPHWARRTLETHEADARPHLYSLEELEQARTEDPLWNAAQRELLREGRIHGYMRMLWGKNILKWTTRPRDALSVMIELNNKYAIDGRDPNSYSGIFWILGRYDRPWPERPVFGKVRAMTSDSARRKFRLDRYLERFGEEGDD